ncbi:hypothetical protein ACHAWF_013118 [Thalassiosira exigua]
MAEPDEGESNDARGRADGADPPQRAATNGGSGGDGGGSRDDQARSDKRKGRASRKNSQQLWDDKLEALREYKRLHGHTNVPKGEKRDRLGRWVNNQRQFYRKREENGERNSLTDERIKDLESLGFVWKAERVGVNRANNLKSHWERRLEELREFKKVHGHCNVPIRGNEELGKFVMNQRYYYKTRSQGQKNSLTPERIRDLEELGFVWSIKGKRGHDGEFLSNEEKWERNVEELKKFKEKFGHVNVSRKGEHTELGQFVGNQRYCYRRRLKGEPSSLTDERIKILSDLGLEWNAKKHADKADISVRAYDGTQVVEKGRDIALPDGSTINCSTKESSTKRLVVLEDSSHMLEITTKTYATKTERILVPPDEESIESGVDVDRDADADADADARPPPFPGTPNVFNSAKSAIFADRSNVAFSLEESSTKRLIVLPGKAHLLETTTMTCTTKVERIRLSELEESRDL